MRATLLDLEPLWKSAERHSLAERADANSKFQDIPFRSRMSIVGQFSPAEIAEMEIDRAGDSLLVAALDDANTSNGINGEDARTVEVFGGLRNGDYVEFFEGVGQVEHIMVGGVLGIETSEFALLASRTNPALQIRLWQKIQDEWRATPVIYNVRFEAVTKLDSLP